MLEGLCSFGKEQEDKVIVGERKEKQRLKCLYRHQLR